MYAGEFLEQCVDGAAFMELEGFQTMHPLCALDLGLGALVGVSDVSAEKDLMEHLGVNKLGYEAIRALWCWDMCHMSDLCAGTANKSCAL